MDDLVENKQKFDFGAEIISTAVSAPTRTSPSTTLPSSMNTTKKLPESKEMLTINSKHEQQQQQKQQDQQQIEIKIKREDQQQEKQQCCHHLQKQETQIETEKDVSAAFMETGRMHEHQIVGQQVLTKCMDKGKEQQNNEINELITTMEDDQTIQTSNIVMKTKVTEKCGMEVVDENLGKSNSNKDHNKYQNQNNHHHHHHSSNNHHHHNNHNHHHTHNQYNPKNLQQQQQTQHHHNNILVSSEQTHEEINYNEKKQIEEKENNVNHKASPEDTAENHLINNNHHHHHSNINNTEITKKENGLCHVNDDQDNDEDEEMDSADDTSSDSNYSDMSGLSEVSGREWKPISARPLQWVQKQIHSGANPRDILSQMLPHSHQLPPGLNDMALWRLLASMLSEPPRRQKLRSVNTFDDVVQLIQESKNIIVLTGAGVSVSCGIPDFRSSDGIYSRLAKDYPDLPDPQAMFDISYFSRDPRPFYKFAREIYPGQFRPSPCHRFIKLLEDKNKLLRNYTQNIDTLEQVAGIRNVIECHGSFSTASCTKCKHKCDAEAIRADIFAQRIPVCPKCQPNVRQSVDASDPVSSYELQQLVENGIMKPDIVFFGEGLPEEFHTVMASDKDKCDLLIVIGSSLKVRPVALIPSSIPANVPQILINREQLHHLEFDVELLGDSDVIINQLCHCLGDDWKEICYNDVVLKECKELLPYKNLYNGGKRQTSDDQMHNGDDDDGDVDADYDGGEEDFVEEDDSQDNDTQSNESNLTNQEELAEAEVDPDADADVEADGDVDGGNGIQSGTESGFESSASSSTTNLLLLNGGVGLPHSKIVLSSAGAIDKSQFEQQQTINKEKELPLDLIEGPNECHSFAERTAAAATSSSPSIAKATTAKLTTSPDSNIPNSQRHFSVDSNKDSGISQYCNESSNSSALTAPSPSPPLPANIIDANNADTTALPSPSPSPSSTATLNEPLNNENGSSCSRHTNNENEDSVDDSQQSHEMSQQRLGKDIITNGIGVGVGNGNLSAADRLPFGYFYCHERTSSYVFPGAQVSWLSDSEDDDDDDEDEENDNDEENDEDDEEEDEDVEDEEEDEINPDDDENNEDEQIKAVQKDNKNCDDGSVEIEETQIDTNVKIEAEIKDDSNDDKCDHDDHDDDDDDMCNNGPQAIKKSEKAIESAILKRHSTDLVDGSRDESSTMEKTATKQQQSHKKNLTTEHINDDAVPDMNDHQKNDSTDNLLEPPPNKKSRSSFDDNTSDSSKQCSTSSTSSATGTTNSTNSSSSSSSNSNNGSGSNTTASTPNSSFCLTKTTPNSSSSSSNSSEISNSCSKINSNNQNSNSSSSKKIESLFQPK